jgi:hypothetical protein
MSTNEHASSDLLRVGVTSKASWQYLLILTLSNLITKVKLSKKGMNKLTSMEIDHEMI